MRKFFLKNWAIITILVLTMLVAWPTFLPGYFSHHDDLQVMRIFEMRKCIEDFQIPCRWVPDMGYGNGYPLFNYYSVLPYYIGALVSYLIGYLGAAKLLFAIPLFLGGISMYLLAKGLFGIYPAIFASILFTFAPYRALDTYVRGAVAESFALAVIPLSFYFSLKLIKDKKIKYIVGLSLSLTAFLTSHNIMTLLFLPVLLILIFYWLLLEKWKNFIPLLISILIGVGLSSFFVIPAYFEKDLVQINNLIRLDLNFRAHFVTLYQLFFDRFWGYGASSPGTNDTISFQIGRPHWWLVILSILIFIINLKSKKLNILPMLLFGIFLFSVFMTHIKSAFIWEKIDILKFTQFPWRFLAISIFTSSLLGAFVLQNLRKLSTKYVLVGLAILTIASNWNFFKPNQFYINLTDQQKLSGKLWEDQQKAAILDYLPKSAAEPREKTADNPFIISGKGNVENFENRSNKWQFQAKLEGKSTVVVPVFDFPKWQVKVNDNSFSQNRDNLGRIKLDLEAGSYNITGKFENTPIRTISNIISLFSLGALLFISYGKDKIFRS